MALTSKAVIKLAETLLERFFREAEATTEHKIDIEYVFHEVGTNHDKADEAIQFLKSRGLIQMEGFDHAFMTQDGIQCVANETSIESLPKKEVMWGDSPSEQTSRKRIEPVEPEPAANPREPTPVSRQPLRKEPAARPEAPQLTIHTDGEDDFVTIPLQQECTLGRLETNDFQLNDPRASKRHAKIKFAGHCYLLEDLGSANGTMLNGEYVEHQALAHGDEIVIGRTIIAFACPEELGEAKPSTPASLDQEFLAQDHEEVRDAFASEITNNVSAEDPVTPVQEDPLFASDALEAEAAAPEMPKMDLDADAFEDGPTIARPDMAEQLSQNMQMDEEDDSAATIAAPPMPDSKEEESRSSLLLSTAPSIEVTTDPELDVSPDAFAETAESLKVPQSPESITSSRFYRIIQILQERVTDSEIPEKTAVLQAISLLAGSPSVQGLVTDLDDV